ncbi:hypothetical protein ES703_110367 [subsurface metagenome]
MCWGDNDWGQIGNGSSGGNILNPIFVNSSKSFVSITGGGEHTCGLLNNGSMMCWGKNDGGQIGDGSTERRENPVFVNTTESFVSITTGYAYTCGLLNNGSMMCWGRNGVGQIGDGTSGSPENDTHNPVFVNTTESFVSITAGEGHTCGLLNNGSAMCWGSNYRGQIGNGSSGGNILNPVFVNTTESFVSITAGYAHTCGLLNNGSMMCWGYNHKGQIGDGTTENSNNTVFVNTTETMESPVIGNVTNIVNGSTAKITWADLDENRTYLWRITVDDGGLIANSPIWKFTTKVICTESWTCTGWSVCTKSVQTRTCTDANSCGTIVDRPALSQSCTMGGGGGITKGQPTETNILTDISPDQPVETIIDNPEIDITKITVEVNQEVQSASITVTVIDVTPQSDIQIRVDGINYQGFKIDTTNLNDTNTENVTIDFRVNKTWLDEQDLTYDSVALYRKPGKPNIWDELNTSFVSEDEDYYYFSAISPGFSIFVIVIDLSVCNNNNICETELGENEMNCPNDCKTTRGKNKFFEIIKQPYLWVITIFISMIIVVLIVRFKKGK